MRLSGGMRIVGAVALGGLVLASASCGKAPTTGGATPTANAGKAIHACMVTDTGGINDRSFNASAYQALKEAKKVNPKDLVVQGWGKESPRGSNATKQGREQNRRVEIVIRNY